MANASDNTEGPDGSTPEGALSDASDITPKQLRGDARRIIGSPVFAASALLILAFVLATAVFTNAAGAVFSAVETWILSALGWFYLLAVAVFLVFSVVLAAGRFGDVKLGPPDSEPEFGFVSWFAMLFSAGMGIGLMFYGVAEPMLHYAAPPLGPGGTVDSAREAVPLALFHWGLHAWSIYVVIGLAIAYFSFRHGLPLTIRSALFPLLGRRIDGPIGHAVDVFAVIGTMFGVATSLGLGVMQVNAGLNYVFNVPQSLAVQFGLIAVITAAATVSVVSGLGKGIRRLSEFNIILALSILLFVLVAGPTGFLFQAFVQNTGAYLSGLVTHTFNLYVYQPTEWIGDWTLFYWGWWISWAPFVGMFIARVSRGRTIREFVIGVLGVPTLLACIWFTVFGNTAIALDIRLGGEIAAAVNESVPTALFLFLDDLPLSAITSLLATLLVVTFFVTSSDSGSLVIDMITSGGMAEPPVWSRVFWAITEGVVAAVLLAVGGLTALQTAAIASGLPFSIVMLFICYGLLRGLQIDMTKTAAAPQRRQPAALASAGSPWQQRLQHIMSYPDRKQGRRFLERVVAPALEKVAAEIQEKASLDATVLPETDGVKLIVSHGLETDFLYDVRLEKRRRPSFAFPEFTFKEEGDTHFFRPSVHLLEGPQHYDLSGLTEAQVISDVLSQYEIHMSLLHVTGAAAE